MSLIKVKLTNIIPKNSSKIILWNNIEFSNCNYIKYDYYIIQNYLNSLFDISNIDLCNNPYIDYTCMLIEKNKTILFHAEPWVYDMNSDWGVHTWGYFSNPTDILHLHNHIYYLNIYSIMDQNCINEIIDKNIIKTQGDNISTIQSNKYFDTGHIKRLDFIKFIENKLELDIDVFGTDFKDGYRRYKGYLDDKNMGYEPYKYYFMGENNYEHNYITEKLFEPILNECLTFYFGCPNVYDYLHPKSFVLLDPYDFEYSYNLMKKAIDENWYQQRLPYIKSEKNRILKLYSGLPTFEMIINYYQYFQVINGYSKIIIVEMIYNTDYIKIKSIINELNKNINKIDDYKIFVLVDINYPTENYKENINNIQFIYIYSNSNNSNLTKYKITNENYMKLLYNICMISKEQLEIIYINSNTNLKSIDNFLHNINSYINNNYDLILYLDDYFNIFYTKSHFFRKCNITLPKYQILDQFTGEENENIYNHRFLYV
jgi:hypothetical protein